MKNKNAESVSASKLELKKATVLDLTVRTNVRAGRHAIAMTCDAGVESIGGCARHIM